MLARFGQIPTRGDWAYQVKWDGFRGLLSTEGRFDRSDDASVSAAGGAASAMRYLTPSLGGRHG
jgi:hypothetical protein